jgi:hypothetical protein
MIAAALLLAVAAPTDLAGTYATSQIEIAGGLELRADGRFRYALDYGAVSETGEGKWLRDGDSVRLTSDPMPREPRFLLVRDDPAPPNELYLMLEDPGFDFGGPLHAIVTVDGETDPALIVADDQGRVDLRGRRVTSVRPLMPVYDTAGEPLALSADRGHRLLFRFEPNELGRAAFRGEALRLDGNVLVMQRYDTSIRFERAQR